MITGAAASAQSPPSGQREWAAPATGIDTATLVVGNRRIITLRSALGASSARERIDRAAARIEELAETESRDSLTLVRIPLGIVVRVAHLEEPASRPVVLSKLHGHIVDLFNEFGVQNLSPHYEGDPPQPLVEPREQWHAAPAGGGAGTLSPRGESP